MNIGLATDVEDSPAADSPVTSGQYHLHIDRSNPLATPGIRADRSLDATEMGLVLSAFFWTYAVMQLPARPGHRQSGSADQHGARTGLDRASPSL
jgi:hypothetical protein